jgi:hypothetical protein
MTCSVEAIANKFIQKALPDGVSHMKLQKNNLSGARNASQAHQHAANQ